MIQFARSDSSSTSPSRPSLGEEIARLSAHIEAATGRLLALIRKFDESEEWVQQGFTSCARWLSWRTGIGPSAARERLVGAWRRADRSEAVVHVSAETLNCDSCDSSDEGGSESGCDAGRDASRAAEPPRIAHGPHIAADTARRLACDAGVVVMTHGPDGSVLDVGRRSRSVPAPIRRALDSRDGTCRFPGCRNRFYQRHHVKGWAVGGRTKLENLVLLCRRHHRLVHEGGWSVEMIGNGDVRFRRPDGTPLPRIPERPAVPEEAAEALEREHEARGIRIDACTVTPDWEGDRLDTGWALGCLR